MLYTWTRGTGQACLLPRPLPQSGARAPALVVPSCVLSSQASISLHREPGTLVLPPGCCSCQGRLSCFPSVSRPQGQRLLLFSGGGMLRLPPGGFSLRQRGCHGKGYFAPCGYLPPSCGDEPRQAAAASTNPTLISQGTLCSPRGDAQAKRFCCMRVSPNARLGSGKQQQPSEHFSANAVLSQRLWLGRTALRCCFLSKASVASGKKNFGRAGASWALLSLAHCSRPGFTLPGGSKQTQPQPYNSMRSLGWHSMHTTLSRCRHRLAFYSGAQANSRTRPVLSHRKGEVTGSLHTARTLNRELWGTVPTPSP